MRRPLHPNELFPAGVARIATTMVRLRTGVTVRVLEAGDPHGTPLVLLHGWGASAYMYRHAFRAPLPGFRLIAVDLRGFGLSDKPAGVDSYSLKEYQADVDALLDELGLPSTALVGQSMGGGLALRYAMSRPDRISKLILINPTCLVSIAGLRAVQLFSSEVLAGAGARPPRWLVSSILRFVAYGDPSLVTDADIDEYWSPTMLRGYVYAAAATLSRFEWGVVSDTEAASLEMPSLVLLGERDRLIKNTIDAAARLRGAHVERVPGGHCAHEEHPDVVYPMIASFVRETAYEAD
ncbi:MAG: alpha/beta hydrolase [Gemmatimonadaceae bacterium]